MGWPLALVLLTVTFGFAVTADGGTDDFTGECLAGSGLGLTAFDRVRKKAKRIRVLAVCCKYLFFKDMDVPFSIANYEHHKPFMYQSENYPMILELLLGYDEEIVCVTRL